MLTKREERQAEEFCKAKPGYIYRVLDDITDGSFTTVEKAMEAVRNELRPFSGKTLRKDIAHNIRHYAPPTKTLPAIYHTPDDKNNSHDGL